MKRFLPTLSLLLGIGAATALAAGDAPVPIAAVTLELYSGRENPSWALNAADSAEFSAKLHLLPEAPESPQGDGHLGYRGLGAVITEAGERHRITLFNGVVVIDRDRGTPRFYRDDDRMLEQWLLSTGEGQVSADALIQAATQFPPSR